MTAPKISVILPVYNAENYIKAAVESILKQTYADFELIIIDDGSKDNSASVIENIQDPRIKFLKQANAGMATTLNKGISLAQGKYIARQDADDISYPTRFELQVEFLEKNPKVGLIGTHAAIIDKDGNKTGHYHTHDTENLRLKADLYFDNPFVHSSVIFRKDVIEKTGLYNTNIHSLLQDFDLWFRISQFAEIHNIPEVLLEYRQLPTGISFGSVNFSELVVFQCYQHLKALFKDSKELKQFAFLYHKCFDKSEDISGSKAVHLLDAFKTAFIKKYNDSSLDPTVFETISSHLKKSLLDHKVYKNKEKPFMNLVSKVQRKLFYPKK